MAHAIVSSLLDQLKSIAQDQVKEKWRLVTGVEQEVGKLTTNLQAIQAVLEDAEQRQMKQDKAVTFWLDQLRDASYNMEDVLEEWITETWKLQLDEGGDDDDDDNDSAFVTFLTKVCSFFPAASNCFGGFKQFSLRHDIAVKIREISEKLDDIARKKDSFKFVENVSNNVRKPERVRTTSLIDEGEVFGRVDEKSELLSKLLGESSEQHPHIISLVGFGGIGKTTLAQLAYNNDEVKRNFEKVIWVCVSDTFEEIRVAKAIIEGLGESKEASGLSEFQSLMSHIYGSIGGKKIFLVLDDVWDGDSNKWDPFFFCLKNGLHGSKILVTTRNESIARMMGTTESDTISIEQLDEEECWLFFKQLAFFGRYFEDCEKLEPIGRKIACKCKGLPLAAKVIGNLLRSKITVKEWQRILDSEMWKVEEIGQGLLAPLLLSYNDLPSNSMVKRCFSYCAVFSKDYSMNKEELISLWMAQGYFNAEEDEEMEMIGEEYFNILATRSFFQEIEKDEDDDDFMRCKMHDIVHDFAQFVCRKECLWLEIDGNKESVINSFDDKVRHLGLNFEGGAPLPMSIHGLNRLRTLLIDDGSYLYPSLHSSILPGLFSKLMCLRALVIRQSSSFSDPGPYLITEIPENVGKLIHLKYLNLSKLCIERLPETLCELYNLQKLDIRGCVYLRELPAGIGKLMNMRSLLNGQTDSLKYLPIGISRLTSLRTLEKFVVGGGVDGGGTCWLESLKNLQLHGKCCIEGLSNVSHVDEAERLQLYNMKNLLRLYLEFGGAVDGEGEAGRRKNEKDKQLLEALQPPLNVEELRIILYGGNIFPKWLTSLTNLRDLILFFCVNCEHLPPLGKLPLEELGLLNLKSVKRVGNEFLGIEESTEDDPSSSSSSSSVIAFPKLKYLEIWGMEELEKWNYRITRKGNISIMPRLSALSICDCPKLKVLPDYILQTTTLQELRIEDCPILEERYREGKGEDWHKISHIPHIKWSPQEFGVDTIMQVIMVCRVSSPRVCSKVSCHQLVQLHVHSEYFNIRLSVTNPSVSTNVLGYGAFIGLHANMRYQLLCGFDRDVANHFEVIGVAMLLSTALRADAAQLLTWLSRKLAPDGDSCGGSFNLQHKRTFTLTLTLTLTQGMAHAIVSALLDQLNSIAQDQVKEKWRLVTGVEQQVGKLTTNLQTIQAVLEDAEQRQMKQDKVVTLWLDQLRDASYDMEDVLDEWITETRKLQLSVCSFFPAASNCFGGFKQLSLRHDIAVKIREISEKLDDIARQKDSFKFVKNVSNNVKEPEQVGTTSFIDEGEVCGRVDEKNELLSKLLCESSEQQEGLHVISLVGLGGIGKTAQLAYKNDS
ncbi:hypothetical protein KPL71_014452 [Citrus sinensis]|uniref:Uncharacterized protein n=1 Tax=Citrus sinensis TaxID=2711 RepID=A0ACB8KBR8_CITSI|nr:hypothetical protein KPL71_014452 [Citrus sinensis]